LRTVDDGKRSEKSEQRHEKETRGNEKNLGLIKFFLVACKNEGERVKSNKKEKAGRGGKGKVRRPTERGALGLKSVGAGSRKKGERGPGISNLCTGAGGSFHENGVG